MRSLYTPFILLVALVSVSVLSAPAQDKLIILVRHAEKADDGQDPELSEAGKQRAARLKDIAGDYRPGAFYSTNFKRTRDTLAPLAAKRKKEVQAYDARQPQQLFDSIMKSDIKRHIIAGHSNTIPDLANVIMGKKLFQNLQDSEYGAIWLIRFDDGKLESVKILPY